MLSKALQTETSDNIVAVSVFCLSKLILEAETILSQASKIIVIGFLFVLLALPVFAEKEKIPVNIKAEVLKYYEDTGQLKASGSVEVKLKGMTIFADDLLMDAGSNIATAEGNVRLFAKEYQANAAHLTYDTSAESTSFLGFSSTVAPASLKGKVFVGARRLDENKGDMLGGPGEMSTCDREHYWLAADRIAYYPDDRLEAWNVVVWVGELPLFWLPYYVYDLKGEKKRNWVFGTNDVEGNYVKTTWNYPYGLLYIDQMEKKGWGYGTQVAYGLAALGVGTLYLYHIDERDTARSDWVTRINSKRSLNASTTLGMEHRYSSIYQVPSGRSDYTSFSLNLNHADQDRGSIALTTLDDRSAGTERFSFSFDRTVGATALAYSINYDQAKNIPGWVRNSQRLYFSRPLWSDSVVLQTSANYYYNLQKMGDSGEEQITPDLIITGREADYSWKFSENWFVDLRQPLYPGETRYQFVEKQPELEIYPRTLDLKLFTLSSAIGYGYYREVKWVPQLSRNRDFSTQRSRLTLDASQSYPFGPGTTLSVGAGGDQFSYATEDQMYAYRERAGTETDLGGWFRNSLNYRKGSTDGNSPFFFDKLGYNYHDISDRLTFYRGDKFSWWFESGRNWQTATWFDLMSGLMLSPDKRWRLTIDGGWDIENHRYRDLLSRLSLSPHSYFGCSLAISQDLNAGEIRQGSAYYDIYFLEKEPNQLRLSFSQVYDTAKKEVRLQDVAIVKDLHCWEMRFNYSDYRKEYSFVFSVKAIPDEPFGFGSGRGFYFEGFEKEMYKFKGEDQRRF
ncbi:hypothetical protein A3K48_06855 [candidate division WOR-1 bacterium RIFOXYA12_FULL_52_29]|uniref:Organic solvent tolerance-like N-terminal domain-containing protein n=1 Tax=candidate division WOR-1 bacterium RIFOXYC12_FULL_54_18 TaxID=1802584 RepID=A0A1F4T7H4_UNCSA|nr:MAG: hypothetical protein A3K44_06855 [candidate division WOR-1 bacterium RIFOXYA2_FULL_51_19]OGC18241.1 MAG: hypothetical protein A3K48_06855 [candidate division WOR-1 bacterium RIFOXYA12_FULL_52_29]OGC27096.1 MAG: hypothetical protein A3K32_06850 [candidate division WOR-1 bacterium RIFOXYB2_FULL_45_9]OGC28658.1 MAG: hypothetical protein A3K49_06855 [candidate division WOR-1 bacterium RIFOXYC12_FULL_54_18]OGC30887.1 MAG: hypothetical protein A2346_05765 [candidate division WOR-1 bacterium R